MLLGDFIYSQIGQPLIFLYELYLSIWQLISKIDIIHD